MSQVEMTDVNGHTFQVDEDEFLDYEVVPVVDGEDQQAVSIRDLQAGSQKAILAEKRIQEATETKKQLEAQLDENRAGLEAVKNIREAMSGDMDAFRKAAKALGYEDDFVNQYISASEKLTGNTTDAGSRAGSPTAGGNGSVPGSTTAESAQALEQAEAILKAKGMTLPQFADVLGTKIIEHGDDQVRRQLTSLVKSESSMKGYSPKQVQGVVSLARNILTGQYAGRAYNNALFQQVAGEAIRQAHSMGIQRDVPVGVGSVPIDPALERELATTKPPKKPHIDAEDDYARWMTRKLAEKQEQLNSQSPGGMSHPG